MGPPWIVYMLRCRDGSLYTGATVDLARRVATHQAGRGAAYTRARLPVALVWSEPAADRSAALRREAALKRLTRPQKLALVQAAARPKRAKAPAKRPAPRPAGGPERAFVPGATGPSGEGAARPGTSRTKRSVRAR